jgi:hypothetical protein
MRLDQALLARMGSARDRRTRGLRSITLDSGVHVYLPTARDLAPVIVLDDRRQFFRRGSDMVFRRVGSDDAGEDLAAANLPAASKRLADLFADLPPLTGAGPAYESFRTMALYERPRLKVEIDAALDALRRSLPNAPKKHKPRRPAMTVAERKRASRSSIAEEERTSAAWALSLWLDDEEEAPEAGSRVPGSVAFEYVSAVLGNAVEEYETTVANPPRGSAESFMSRPARLEEWEGLSDEEGYPPRPRLASRRRVYDVAREIGLRTTRPHNVIHLHIPTNKEESVKNAEHLYEAMLDRMARVAYDEHREGFDEYIGRLAAEKAPEREAPPTFLKKRITA